MNDVFVSYSQEDRATVERIVLLLQEQGWSVFWDRRIPPGKTWDEIVQEEVERARAVVVVWSRTAIDSGWVRSEATVGLERDVLVPVVIHDVTPPLPFRRHQAARLAGRRWDSAETDGLLGAVASLVNGAPTDTILPPTTERADPDGETAQVELAIARDFDSFSEKDQRKLLKAIQALKGVEGGVRLIDKRPGSVLLRLELSAADAERLVRAIEGGELADHGVTRARLIRTTSVAPADILAGRGQDRDLFARLYDELRRMAEALIGKARSGRPASSSAYVLEPTALVNELWIRLQGQRTLALERESFLAYAAMAMRRLIVDDARQHQAQRRGGSRQRLDLDAAVLLPAETARLPELLEIDEALEQLRKRSERLADVVELRFYGGLTQEDVAHVLGVNRTTVNRDWRAAKALLRRMLEEQDEASDSES